MIKAWDYLHEENNTPRWKVIPYYSADLGVAMDVWIRFVEKHGLSGRLAFDNSQLTWEVSLNHNSFSCNQMGEIPLVICKALLAAVIGVRNDR